MISFDSIKSNLERLENQADQLLQGMAEMEHALQSRQVSIIEAEKYHQKVQNVFNEIVQNVVHVGKNIESIKNYSNQDQIYPYESQASAIDEKAKTALNNFNDTLLTVYPTAKIAYGDSCINPQKSTIYSPTKLPNGNYTSMREIRGDGNCFISSFITRYLEVLAKEGKLSEFLDSIYNDGMGHFDLKGEIVDTLTQFLEYPSQREKILQDNAKMLPLIKYFRLLTAAEMINRQKDTEDFFIGDIEGNFNESTYGISYPDLIEKYVVRMGTDFSHTAIKSLCSKLQFSVKVLDPKLGDADGLNILEDYNLQAQATFCRTGAHYFVLYSPQESNFVDTSPVQQNNNINNSPIRIINNISRHREIIIQCQVANQGDTIFVRGDEKAGLSWDKGTPLTQIEDIWSFETNAHQGAYKFLLNDEIWEDMDGNREFSQENTAVPKFILPENLKIEEKPYTPIITINSNISSTTTTTTTTTSQIQPSNNLNPSYYSSYIPSVYKIFGYFSSPQPTQPIANNIEIKEEPHTPVITTKITVKCDAGFGNTLYILGEGPGMSWAKGIKLQKLPGDSDSWIFETQENFQNCNFKICRKADSENDNYEFEAGENRSIKCGNETTIHLKF